MLKEIKSQHIGVILLAAGASVRLGRPKQLLTYQGSTLLHHSLNTALTSNVQSVVVVLGAHSNKIEKELKNTTAHIVVNADWQEGMASSIRCGVKAFIEKWPAAEGLLLMVCDQPFVKTHLLNELITVHQKTGKQIVACSYKGTFGPPTFFHRSFFEELLCLKGDIGARSIVNQHIDMTEIITFPEGSFDVDTDADYERLTGNDK